MADHAKHAAAQKELQTRLRRYFAALPAGPRRALKQLRQAIRETAPSAVEAFGYGIPGFRLDDRTLVWYAAWKEHISLYPITAKIQRAQRAALTGRVLSKGTVRFPLAEPLPLSLVKRLVRARMAEVRTLSRGSKGT